MTEKDMKATEEVAQEEAVQEKEEVFVCDVCDREFDSQRGLSLHMNSHDEPKASKPKPKKTEVKVRGQLLVTH